MTPGTVEPAEGVPTLLAGSGPGRSLSSPGPAAWRPLQVVAALRPRQWTKNVLVFVAPATAQVLRHETTALRALGAFGIFCAAASGTYLLNDTIDADADRRHPEKRHRPVASGAISPRVAVVGGAGLMAAALAASWLLAGWALALVIGAYLLISLAYTLRLKREPVVELAAVASGFVLRGIAGGVATGVPLSSWFLVVTLFGALFVVTGKRAAEHLGLGEGRSLHRPVLALYTPSFLRSTLTMTATATATAYCLWAFERTGLASRAGHRFVWVELTVIPVVLGILYVLRLLDAGEGGSPEELVLHDHFLQVLALGWIVMMGIGLYA